MLPVGMGDIFFRWNIISLAGIRFSALLWLFAYTIYEPIVTGWPIPFLFLSFFLFGTARNHNEKFKALGFWKIRAEGERRKNFFISSFFLYSQGRRDETFFLTFSFPLSRLPEWGERNFNFKLLPPLPPLLPPLPLPSPTLYWTWCNVS